MKGWHEVLAAVRAVRGAESEGVPGEVPRPYLRCTEGCLRAEDYGIVLEGNPVFFGWADCPVHGVEAQKASIRELIGDFQR